jgi:hypothetical protein
LGKWFCRQSSHFPKIKFQSEKMVSRNLDLSVFFVSRLTLRTWKILSTAKLKGGGVIKLFSIIFVAQAWNNQGKILELKSNTYKHILEIFGNCYFGRKKNQSNDAQLQSSKSRVFRQTLGIFHYGSTIWTF